MENIYIDVPAETKRTELKSAIIKTVVNAPSNEGMLSDLPFSLSREEWMFNKSVLESPRRYNQANKQVIADINAEMGSADYLTSIANNIQSTINFQLDYLDRKTLNINKKLSLIEGIELSKDLGSDVWVTDWENDEDIEFKSTETNTVGDSYPARCSIETNRLQLGIVSNFKISDLSLSDTLIIDDWIGGDLDTQVRIKPEGVENFPIKIVGESIKQTNLNYYPWIVKKDSLSYLKLKLNYVSSKIFSDIYVRSGDFEFSSIDSVYWSNLGNELASSLCPVNMSLWTHINSQNIAASGSTIYSVSPLYSNHSVLNAGSNIYSASGNLYTAGSKVHTTFPVSSYEETMRLNIHWRRSGYNVVQDNAFVNIQFIGTSGTVLYEETKSLKYGLDVPENTLKDEFMWSRYIISKPANCLYCKIEIYSVVSESSYDPANKSVIEVGAVGFDNKAGRYSDSYVVNNSIYSAQGSYIRVPYSPEAKTLYIVLSSNKYKREFNNSLFQYVFDFTLSSLTVNITDFIYSSRWTSKPKRFLNTPRKFLLKTTSLPTNMSVRLSLKDNLTSIEMLPNSPIIIAAEGEVSLFDETVFVPVNIKTEVFEGTDLSGKVVLASDPYVSMKSVYTVASAISGNTDLVYDPNAVTPQVSII